MMEIFNAKQWLIWMFDGGRKRCANVDGRWCGSTDQTQYVTYQAAVEAADGHSSAQGPAFVFTADDPWVGVDLDDCLENGELKEWAEPIVARFGKTYIEVSPSCCGLKIYARGQKPAGKQSAVQLPDGAIEVYDRGRFFAFTGVASGGAVEVVDCQEEIDWLYETYFPQRQAVETQLRELTVGGDLLRRAMAYVDTVPTPAVGGRNAAAFRLAGHLYAILGDDGEILADDQVLELVMHWNERSAEPLDQKELMSCVRNARTKGTPREPKVSSRPIVDTSGVEELMRQLVEGDQVHTAETPPAIQRTIPLPAELLQVPGMIGEFIRYCGDTCFLRQPALFLAAGICLQAVLSGRKVVDMFNNRPNVYFLCLAESGTGKEHARAMVARILSQVGAAVHADLDNPRSGSSLVRSLSSEPARIAMIDEFGRFFRFNKNANAGFQQELVDHMLKLYSQGEGSYSGAQFSDARQNITVDRPSLSLLATTVPESLLDNLSQQSLVDGLMSRLLVLWGEDDPEDGPQNPTLAVPDSLRDHCRSWLTFGGDLGSVPGASAEQQVEHTAEAERIARDIIANARKLPAATQAQKVLRSRIAQNTCKLALCYACSRDARQPIIDVDAVQWGYALTMHVYQSITELLEHQIPEGEFHKRCLRVVDWLGRQGGQASLTAMARRFRAWTSKDRTDVLKNLQETQQVEIENSTTKGRPAVTLRLISHSESGR